MLLCVDEATIHIIMFDWLLCLFFSIYFAHAVCSAHAVITYHIKHNYALIYRSEVPWTKRKPPRNRFGWDCLMWGVFSSSLHLFLLYSDCFLLLRLVVSPRHISSNKQNFAITRVEGTNAIGSKILYNSFVEPSD